MPKINEQQIDAEKTNSAPIIQDLIGKGTKSELEQYIDQIGFTETLHVFSRLD